MTDQDENLEAARKLFAGPCDFVLGVAALGQLPVSGRPEVAFAGRSNVGKSSLVNALTGRRTLAKTSNTPGRTQQLNYFDLGGLLYLVDMPGYGYAKVSKAQKAEWNSLIRAYLRGRSTLRCVLMLVDARHGLKDSDLELLSMLGEAGVSCRIVLTKADKAKAADLDKIIAEIEKALKDHACAFPEILVTSSEKSTGLDDLRVVIAAQA
jgi:GTP-binding protein